jgi:hypothetical protein
VTTRSGDDPNDAAFESAHDGVDERRVGRRKVTRSAEPGAKEIERRSGATALAPTSPESTPPKCRSSYFAVLGHVREMLDEPGSSLREQLDRVWAGRTFYVVYDRPLLFLAALRADALTEGPTHPLYDAVAADPPRSEEVTRERVRAAISADRRRWLAMLATRRVQTNETLRAVAWRWPAWLAGCDAGARPLALVDLGASAGLNLVAERLPATWTDAGGAALPVATTVHAVIRLGLDARPVDLTDPDNVTWMRACIWPGDRGRGERLESALSAWTAAQQSGEGPMLEVCDVSGFSARVAQIAVQHPDALVIAYQSYLRDYLPSAVRQAHREAMHACLSQLDRGRVVWVELEATTGGSDDSEPAAITVHVRTPHGDVGALEIARTHHHPTRVEAGSAAVRELRSSSARRTHRSARVGPRADRSCWLAGRVRGIGDILERANANARETGIILRAHARHLGTFRRSLRWWSRSSVTGRSIAPRARHHGLRNGGRVRARRDGDVPR